MIQRGTPCAIVLTLAGSASAQIWLPTRIHDDHTALWSQVNSVGPAAGSMWDNAQDSDVAVIWWGSQPAQVLGFGEVAGVSSGYYWNGGFVGALNGRATNWVGTSSIDLAPPGSLLSEALAADPGMQVGWVEYEIGSPHAAMWRGSSASFIDLHPAGALRSCAMAVSGLREAGYVVWPGPSTHATIWFSDPQFPTDLNPPGMQSQIRAMTDTLQVGFVEGDDAVPHAAVWNGSSFTDYNPPGWNTRLLATNGAYHVGEGGPGTTHHALLNRGGPNDWVDLHQTLPEGYSESAATSIGFSSGGISIGGYAVNAATGLPEAFTWHDPSQCYANCDHSTTPPFLNVNDFICFMNKFASGDSYANCDNASTPPILNVLDFGCFLNRFAQGCD